MSKSLQETMDSFVFAHLSDDECAEQCMQMLAEYLLHFSDLFNEEVENDASQLAEWEEALEQYVEQMIDNDIDEVSGLGSLPVSAIDPEHIRDFLGWFLLREPGIDSLEFQKYADMVKQWIESLQHHGALEKDRSLVFNIMLQEIVPEGLRVVKAARLLLHFVRLGGGVSPRLRERRFSHFVEGHARISSIEEQQMWLTFDNHKENIGPVLLPEEIARHLKIGDVLDIEMGLRGDVWLIVDIGPVYPGDIYIEADVFNVSEKKAQRF
ncbi:MAG: hypothetical protein R8K22_02715 [Mariprofundaceae bacterium]